MEELRRCFCGNAEREWELEYHFDQVGGFWMAKRLIKIFRSNRNSHNSSGRLLQKLVYTDTIKSYPRGTRSYLS